MPTDSEAAGDGPQLELYTELYTSARGAAHFGHSQREEELSGAIPWPIAFPVFPVAKPYWEHRKLLILYACS